MIKAHINDAWANQYTPEWCKPDIDRAWRSCSYCGSIHPEDLLKVLKIGGYEFSGSDWKYGYPHKFYVGISNPEPDRDYLVSFRTQNGKTFDEQYGKKLLLHGKFYVSHLLDDETPKELFDVLAEVSRIRFRVENGRLAYVAPYHGFQIYKGLKNIPNIPEWPDELSNK